MNPGLNYGQQCFEGLKAFRDPHGNISLFRPRMNAQRMQHSAVVASLAQVPEDLFVECCQLAVALNAEFVPPHDTGASMYIRPLLFGSCAQLGLNPPAEYTFCVFVLPAGVYHGVNAVDALILEDFDRAAPNGTGNAKLGGNYAPVLRFSERAYKEGFGITLHLDSQTRSEIDEFSTSGFIGVKKTGDGYTLTVPNSKAVIRSVTSDSVQEIAKTFGWKVDKRPIPYGELKEFDEVLAAGTAAALVPIKSVIMKSRGDKFEYLQSSEPGPVCLKLLATLRDRQFGRVEDDKGWLTRVVPPEGYGTRDGEQTNGTEAMVSKLP